MFPEHPWAGVTHHDSNLFPSVTLVAMHRALGAGRLLKSETTAIQPQSGILEKFLALRTRIALMVIPAINLNHGCQGLKLATYPLANKYPRTRSGSQDS